MKVIAESSGESVELLGVDTSTWPSASMFPTTFGREGSSLWRKIFESSWYEKNRPAHTDPSLFWTALVKQYLKLCEKNGIYPFSGLNDETSKTTNLNFLVSARQLASDFFDRTEFFTKVGIVSLKRNFTFNRTSFIVESTATLKGTDPTTAAWITKPNLPGFKLEDGVYRRTLKANVDLLMKEERGLWTLTLRIFCHTPVLIPNLSKIPTRKRLATYAEKTLWLPAVRQQRFLNIGNRLF